MPRGDAVLVRVVRRRVAWWARARPQLLLELTARAATRGTHALASDKTAAARHRAFPPFTPPAPYFTALQSAFVNV